MTSLTVPHCGATQAVSHGVTSSGVAPLDPFVYRDMRWCLRCGRAELFVEVFECAHGRAGVCMGCGKEELVPFSREVAA
jgi:hypothetical protein